MPLTTADISTFSRPFGPRVHMDEAAAPSEPVIARTELPANAPESFTSASSAADYFNNLRNKKPAESATEPVATAETAETPESASPEADAAPAEQATGETQEAAPAASQEEKPPRELPRSWTKDRTEHWNKLDPDTQDFLLDQDRKASAEVRRVQNEVAEQRKANDAERSAAEQARQQYEEKAKGALKVLEREQLRDFPDIKSIADVNNLLATDPLRYLQWDMHQKELVAASDAVKQANQQAATDQWTQWTKHVDRENELAKQAIPELADKGKSDAFYKRATDRLGELGFTPAELGDLVKGTTKLSIHDHRLQQLLRSDFALADMQAKEAAAKAAPKPKPAAAIVPPVVRPGASVPRVAADSQQIKDLEAKFNKSGDLNDAVALQRARSRAAERRAS